MVADNGGKVGLTHEAIEHLTILRSLRNEIADGDKTVVAAKLDLIKQVNQFVVAAVNITDYDCARTHSYQLSSNRFVRWQRISTNIRPDS